MLPYLVGQRLNPVEWDELASGLHLNSEYCRRRPTLASLVGSGISISSETSKEKRFLLFIKLTSGDPYRKRETEMRSASLARDSWFKKNMRVSSLVTCDPMKPAPPVTSTPCIIFPPEVGVTLRPCRKCIWCQECLL